MLKTVTRALYNDGELIAEYTQDPMADSELADIEQIAAQMELLERPKEAQNRTYVSSNASNPFRPLGKGRPKAIKLKLKLLQAVSKMLLLGHEPAVKRHVVCLYIEHHMETASQISSDVAQP